jgi:hypothetical protein
MELLISILVGLGIMEAYAWLPATCQWLLESAVSHLPTENQERCREEWTESLEALPNTAMRLGPRLIKSTIPGPQRDTQRRGSCAPACRSGLRRAGNPSTC